MILHYSLIFRDPVCIVNFRKHLAQARSMLTFVLHSGRAVRRKCLPHQLPRLIHVAPQRYQQRGRDAMNEELYGILLDRPDSLRAISDV